MHKDSICYPKAVMYWIAIQKQLSINSLQVSTSNCRCACAINLTQTVAINLTQASNYFVVAALLNSQRMVPQPSQKLPLLKREAGQTKM